MLTWFDEGKQAGSKMHQEPAVKKEGLAIYGCELFDRTASENFTNTPKLRDRYLSFIQVKIQNPLAPFGKSDRSMIGGGIMAGEIPGIRHAHLTQDISIFYIIKGTNPTALYLYAILSHGDSGTGNPANMHRQQSVAQRFKNQKFRKIT